MKIFAKINSHEALQNFDEILACADGIVIDRAGLASEIPVEKVAIAQKWMIEKANISAKTVVVMS